LYNNEKVEMALCKWLWMQEFKLYNDGVFKVMPMWNKCIILLMDYVEKY
jgi:hypothetical protein